MMNKAGLKKMHIKNLDWLFSFLQQDLNVLSEGDWLNLYDSLYYFIYWSQEFMDVEKMKDAARRHYFNEELMNRSLFSYDMSKTFYQSHIITKEIVYDLHRFLSKYLIEENDLFPKRIFFYGKVGNVRINVYPAPDDTYMVSFGPDEEWGTDYIIQSAQLALAEHLVGSGVTTMQIRNCPECKRIFLLKMKPRADRNFYCSLRCSRSAATKKYRKVHAADMKAKERQRNSRRYLAKQQKKYRTTIKITKRTRG